MAKKKDEMHADGSITLCGANAYDKKYYFNQKFDKLPQSIQDELHIICVLFTEEVCLALQHQKLQFQSYSLQ